MHLIPPGPSLTAEDLRLPAHSNGIPTTCTLEMAFFSQLRNNPEVTGLPVCHVI